MKKLPSLTIFFPAFNEQDNIVRAITVALTVAPKVTRNFEVVVIDDASTDETAARVKDIAIQNPNVHLISHQTNQGYGKAVKTGLETATGEYVFFTDSDLQFDLSELEHLVVYADDYDVVIGYRHKRMDPWPRLVNAKGWNVLNRLFFDLRVKDIDCAFKLLRRDVVNDVTLISNGAMLSAELLIRLQQQGLRFKEVPVTHYPRQRGVATGAKPSVIVKAFAEMLSLFWADLGRPTRQQAIRYAAIGALNTGVDLTGYFLLTQLVTAATSTWEVIAKSLSFLLGAFTSFTLNRSLTFPSGLYQSRGFLPYVSVALIGLMVNASLFALARALGLDQFIAVSLATIGSFVLGFSLIKMFIFQPIAKV